MLKLKLGRLHKGLVYVRECFSFICGILVSMGMPEKPFWETIINTYFLQFDIFWVDVIVCCFSVLLNRWKVLGARARFVFGFPRILFHIYSETRLSWQFPIHSLITFSHIQLAWITRCDSCSNNLLFNS